MTAPVIMQEKLSESIAMTAPVMAEESKDSMKMTFSMPKKYTLATLPKANDSRIVFAEIPAKTFAVYKFGWYYSEKRIRTKKAEFIEILKKDNVKTIGAPIFAGYNGPGTIPFLVRNEILVEMAQ
jgi:anionic cell wall polymer biosynthesis LytR-Cps2A-Psr (LCP) family protein